MLPSDLDWFVFDEAGSLIHFTSAGGYFPPFVTKEVIEAEKRILALPELCPHILPSPNLYHDAAITSLEEYNWLIGSYEEHARRGLFTYDKRSPYYQGSAYFLVASPVVRLPYEAVPEPIRKLVPRVSNRIIMDLQAPLEIIAEELMLGQPMK